MNTLLEINPSILPNTALHAAPATVSFLDTLLEQKELTPQLVTDDSLLKEVYDLRLNVWEHSGNTEFVNRNLYPDGWYDELDETAYHWIVINDENKIIASDMTDESLLMTDALDDVVENLSKDSNDLVTLVVRVSVVEFLEVVEISVARRKHRVRPEPPADLCFDLHRSGKSCRWMHVQVAV